MPHVHVHLHNGKVTQDAKTLVLQKAQRKLGCRGNAEVGNKRQRKQHPVQADTNRTTTHTHSTGQRAASGQTFYEYAKKTRSTKQQMPEWHTLSPENKAKYHKVAFEQEQGLFNAARAYGRRGRGK
jgi:hypothetical protein